MPDRNNPPGPMVFEPATPYSLDKKASEEFHENISATVQDENTEKPPSSKSGIDISNVDERKLLRKLDWQLIPWLTFLYLLSFLDRSSIGNARVCLQCSSLFLYNANNYL